MPVRTRAALSAVVGIVAAVAVVACGLWQLAPLVGWDVTAAVFISWVLVTILPMRGPETAALGACVGNRSEAERARDGTRPTGDEKRCDAGPGGGDERGEASEATVLPPPA
jgi:hypothetical protein